MPNVVVVGAQWGDEGKGKVIDILARDADIVVRYQGGNNAGHSVVIDDEEFILHLIPSGILHRDKICVIGNGVVLDPEALISEIGMLRNRGINVGDNLLISEEAHLIFPYHRILDSIREKRGRKIGTTGRGIGPCYADKAARCGIRFADLLNTRVFESKLKVNVAEKNLLFTKVYGIEPVSFDDIYKKYLAYQRQIKEYATNCSVFLNDAVRQGKSILFEGAQGTLLDVDHGTYPYVSSSNASAGGACTGTGVGPTRIDMVIGAVKAYTTRVGEGPLPTELLGKMGERLRTAGPVGEFGRTTGRPRRCGWFDAVICRYAAMINGLDRIAILRLDVLDGLKSIKICVGYGHGRKTYEVPPANTDVLAKCKPIYEEHKGWSGPTSGIRKYGDLPGNARSYARRISTLLGVPIYLISVGPKRDQTIFCQ
jgi:adenylosuccinate synthase